MVCADSACIETQLRRAVEDGLRRQRVHRNAAPAGGMAGMACADSACIETQLRRAVGPQGFPLALGTRGML